MTYKTHKTAGEGRTNTLATFSYGLLHMDTPVLADKKNICSSPLWGHWVPCKELTKTDSLKGQMVRESRESVLPLRLDEDDHHLHQGILTA